ncbi:MAG: aminoglycoside phosphotransferase family protein [Porphyromonadaceae bacterium]|nr:aminoglycoside phosphotransferase family protein [Porphyromonadaceae bacterium]
MRHIVEKFQIKSEPGAIKPLKKGFANESFIVESKDPGSEWYFLQKINHKFFKNITGLQNNIRLVTDHLRKKLAERGYADLERRVLQLIPAKDGSLFYKDDEGNFWRVYVFIRNTKSFDTITPELAYKAGLAFGDFQSMLADLPSDMMIEIIPNFHNMEFRLEEFREAVKNDAADRMKNVHWMVKELESRADDMCIPERLHREGKLPKRIIHYDTKLSNILFDENDEPICIVDLDTVMPGYVLSDYGDFMRSAANTGAEDDENLENIGVNFSIFEAYTKGYMEKAKGFLVPTELGNLAFGVKLQSYMQTVRFFTAYLNDSTYYKTKSPEHNWKRALAQFELLKKQEEAYERMQNIVFECVELQ